MHSRLTLWAVSVLFAVARSEICENRVCEYDFTMHRRQTMTYNDDGQKFNVQLNGSELVVVENNFKLSERHGIIGSVVEASDVITADGYSRDVIVVNDQFPAPTIEVMEGAEVIVHVTNHLVIETLTLHWHGIHQQDTNLMDGTAYVTQCPIQPLQKFTYRFKADPAGTHWYHSHISNQRQDGVFGLLIVHKALPAFPNHGLTVIDWYHKSGAEIESNNPYGARYSGSADLFGKPHVTDFGADNTELTPLLYVSTLVSGRGRWKDEQLPLETYVIPDEGRVRFRLASAAAEVNYEVSVDSHDLDIVASDGHEVKPIRVSSFFIFPGETMDFEVAGNQRPDRYWIRMKTFREGQGHYPASDGVVSEGLAVLAYSSVVDGAGDPKSLRRNCTMSEPCTVFNCPFEDYAEDKHRSCIDMYAARSLCAESFLKEKYGVNEEEEIHEVFLNMAFVVGSSINARKYDTPRAPLIQGNVIDLSDYIVECDEAACSNGCKCTNIVDLPYNKTIQMVLYSIEPASMYPAHHSMHLHGHSFAVMAMGFPDFNASTGFWESYNTDILCNSNLCNQARWNGQIPELNFENPPIKDTINVPAQGYVVVRFRADNPGFWLFHCHQNLHFTEGMALVFNEAPGMHKQLPSDFPTCVDYEMNSEEYEKYKGQGNMELDVTTTQRTTPDGPFFIESDNTVVLTFGTAVGAAIGFLLLGAFLVLLPMAFTCCYFRYKKHNDKFVAS